MNPSDDQLRTLLDDAVSDVDPGYGLDRIRARTAHGHSRRLRMRGVGAAVLATAATVVAVAALASNLGSDTDDTAGVAQQPSGAASDGPAQRVFFVGSTGAGPRLFPEQHRAPGEDGALTAAVAAAVEGDPDDPDYRTPWPDGTTMQRAQLEDDVLSVDLTGDLADRPSAMTRQEAALALQQLVHTAQGAAGRQLPVTFLLDGERTPTLLGEPTQEPVTAAPAADVLAQMSITSPSEGVTVTSPFEVTGEAAAFEANVQWELMQGDTVVERGFTTARECCTLSPYSFQVTAPPGEYTLVVHDEDVSGGEGLPPNQDTRTVVVER